MLFMCMDIYIYTHLFNYLYMYVCKQSCTCVQGSVAGLGSELDNAMVE